MVKTKAIRVRLDLSSISNVEHKLQWAYIPLEKLPTINDFIRTIVSKRCKVDRHKIELYLQEPFVLPRSEDIRVLQNGDLINVKLKDKDAASQEIPKEISSSDKDHSQKNRVPSNPLQKTSQSSSSSDTTESSSSSPNNFESNKKGSKQKPNSASVMNNRKRTRTSSSDLSSSSSDTSTGKVNSNNVTKDENPKVENVEEQKVASSGIPKVMPNKVTEISNQRESSSSSSSTESSSDSQQTCKKKIVENKSNNMNGHTKIIQPCSDSEEPPAELSSSKQVKSNSNSKVDSSIDIKAKRKRKRKRKSKNKNKLQPNDIRNVTEEAVMNALEKPVIDEETKKTDCRSVPTFNGKANSSKNHIYFEDDEDNDEAMECEQTEIRQSPTKKLSIESEGKSEELNIKANDNSCSETLNNTSNIPQISWVNTDFLPKYSLPEIVPPKKKKLEPSSRIVSCEEALLGNIQSNKKSLNGINSTDNYKKLGITKSFQAALPPSSSPLPKNSLQNIDDFKQLLSFAKSSPIRASRSCTVFNPVTRSNDVWSNRSIMMQGEDPVNKKEVINKQLDLTKMESLTRLPSVGDRIAFKVFEMSENYTPELSDYKFGEVKESFAEQNKVKIKIDRRSINTKTPKDGKFEMPEFDITDPTINNEGNEKMLNWNEIYEAKRAFVN